MLVSHEKKFIYLKCGKTASTSTEAFFQPYCGDTSESVNVTQVSTQGIISHSFQPLPGTQFKAHTSAAELKDILSQEVWGEYFIFANVRNPFDAVVSAYFDQRGYIAEDLSFRDWWRNHSRGIDSIWTIISIDEKLVVDDFIRYENLLTDMERICEKLDISFNPTGFPKLRTTERPSTGDIKIPYKDVILDQELVDEIGDIFHRTCEEFGYAY